MKKKIEKFTVENKAEETECEQCGEPLYKGDVAFLVGGHRVGCGHYCAVRLLERLTEDAA